MTTKRMIRYPPTESRVGAARKGFPRSNQGAKNKEYPKGPVSRADAEGSPVAYRCGRGHPWRGEVLRVANDLFPPREWSSIASPRAGVGSAGARSVRPSTRIHRRPGA